MSVYLSCPVKGEEQKLINPKREKAAYSHSLPIDENQYAFMQFRLKSR